MLKDYQSNNVPGFVSENKKEVVVNVPVPGDRYSKRLRNVEWTFRDEHSSYKRLAGFPPEHADWHTKVTPYKVIPSLAKF